MDEWTGYRYYSPDQLDQARLVAWLRRLDMPLAKIKEISGSPSAEVAAEVAAFVREAEADFAERKRLALFLVSYFSQGATAMSESAVPASAHSSSPAAARPLAIRYAAASDRGRCGTRNQDAGYACPGCWRSPTGSARRRRGQRERASTRCARSSPARRWPDRAVRRRRAR